jgi:predicted CXXCH cytochrome family protein
MKSGNETRFAAGLAAAFALVAMLASGAASAGIAATKHNLSSGGLGAVHTTGAGTSTDEICVFCHTPHGADTSAAVPLWNKKLPSGTGYQTYKDLNSSTIDGEILTTVGSVSLACLSCHDGTQAMDNIINAPGSGGYDTTGGGATGLAYSWIGTGTSVDADGKMIGATTNIALIGTDLKNDHPIGIQYCGGGPITGTPAAACKDGDFKDATMAGGLKNATINNNLVWWVDSGTAADSRDKADMILYTRTFAAGAGPSVECATCHDPHAEDTPTKKTFLRIANTGSAVCLACHVK